MTRPRPGAADRRPRLQRKVWEAERELVALGYSIIETGPYATDTALLLRLSRLRDMLRDHGSPPPRG